MSPDPLEETRRDINMARAELNGRRDQMVADFDDRLAQLDRVLSELGSGSIEPRAAQARVRQILGERNKRPGSSASERRAGRTKIGLSVPSDGGGMAGGGRPIGPTPPMATASLNKGLGALDGRVVAVLVGARDSESRNEAKLELALLLSMRRALEAHLADPPSDAVLIESVIAYGEEVQNTVGDLVTPGLPRVRQLLRYARTVAGELTALGVDVSDIKTKVKEAQKAASSDEADHEALLRTALAAFSKLQHDLEKRWPTQKPTLLEDITKP